MYHYKFNIIYLQITIISEIYISITKFVMIHIAHQNPIDRHKMVGGRLNKEPNTKKQ